METIRQHGVILEDGPLRLRPMSERDWDILLKWNNDPEVLFFSEGGRVERRTLEEVQGIYRGVSGGAWVFVAELDGRPIGECWLQRMNMDRVLRRHPDASLFRIDLMIGEKAFWGRGWGTRIIRLLTDFGFRRCGAEAVFGTGVGGHNPRSRRAFERNGYVVDQAVPQPAGSKAAVEYDLVLWREAWSRRRADGQGG